MSMPVSLVSGSGGSINIVTLVLNCAHRVMDQGAPAELNIDVLVAVSCNRQAEMLSFSLYCFQLVLRKDAPNQASVVTLVRRLRFCAYICSSRRLHCGMSNNCILEASSPDRRVYKREACS